MSDTPDLAAIKARQEAASKGMKYVRYDHGGGRAYIDGEAGARKLVIDTFHAEDTEFYFHALADVDALLALCEQQHKDLAFTLAQIRETEEFECQVCPEDVGFEEYIPVLNKQIEALTADLARAHEQIGEQGKTIAGLHGLLADVNAASDPEGWPVDGLQSRIDAVLGGNDGDCGNTICHRLLQADQRVEALEASLRERTAERDEAMKVLAPNMPEQGLVDACRQVKQAMISWRDNCQDDEKLTARVQSLEAETTDLLLCLDGVKHDPRCRNHFAGDPDRPLCQRCAIESLEAALSRLRSARDKWIAAPAERKDHYLPAVLAGVDAALSGKEPTT